MLKHMYARFVLWLIRPALKIEAGDRISVGFINKDFKHEVIDIVVKDMRKNGPIARSIKGGL